MSNYWENIQEYESRGIDYDLYACLEYNPQSFVLSDIKKVLAVWEGEHDGDDWRWVLQLNDDRFVFLQGGCDYTGWDCQSWATHAFAESPEECANFALGNIEVDGSVPSDAGLGHMIQIVSGTYMQNAAYIRQNLLDQLKEGKNTTWTEEKKKEFCCLVPPHKLYIWSVCGNYAVDVYVAIARSVEEAKQQILAGKFYPSNDFVEGQKVLHVENILNSNEPDIYPVTEPMAFGFSFD